MKLPDCKGYSTWTDCGTDYDCEYNEAIGCDECLCQYHQTGGIFNPETGRWVPRWLAFVLYGKRKIDLGVDFSEELYYTIFKARRKL